jgi:CRP-like cAMP-binding protein
MHDDIPTSVQRLLALRQHAGFANADLSELATMAENLVEHVFHAGEVVATPSTRVGALHMVVEGQLVSSTARGTISSWGPRQVFGVLEVIANRTVAAPVVAMTETRTLGLGAADLSEVLEDNFGLLTNALRGVSHHLFALRDRRSAASWRRPAQVIVPTEDCGLVERLIVLRQHFPFARIQALASLAHQTTEVRLAPGERFRQNGDTASGALVILDGAVRSYRPHAETLLAPNDALGILETLARQPHTSTSEAVGPTRVLEVPGSALFDVMEDHTDLALGLLTMLAGELLDANAELDDNAN